MSGRRPPRILTPRSIETKVLPGPGRYHRFVGICPRDGCGYATKPCFNERGAQQTIIGHVRRVHPRMGA